MRTLLTTKKVAKSCVRSQMRRLAPLFLLVLLLSPAPAMAAENFWNPRPTQGAERNLNTTLSVFPGCCEILVMTSCLNGSVELLESNNQVLQFTGAVNGTDVYNEWIFTSTSTKNCPGGCSDTLSACRPELPYQFLEVIALFVVLGLVAYFAYDLGIVGILAGATSWILTLYLATWDAFSEPLLTIVRILPLLYLLFLVFTWRFKADLDTDEET